MSKVEEFEDWFWVVGVEFVCEDGYVSVKEVDVFFVLLRNF